MLLSANMPCFLNVIDYDYMLLVVKLIYGT